MWSLGGNSRPQAGSGPTTKADGEPRLREAVKAVILGRMALITLVAAMAVAFSDTGLSLTRH